MHTPHLHQWSCSGACVEFQLPWHPHLWWPHWSLNTSTLVKKAQQCLYFLRSQESQDPCGLLPLYHWEHTHKLHLSVVQQLLRIRPQSTPAGGENCSTDHRHPVNYHWEHLSQALPGQGKEHHQGCLTPPTMDWLFTLLPSGRRYRSLCSHTSRLRKSFFPKAVTLLNSTPPI